MYLYEIARIPHQQQVLHIKSIFNASPDSEIAKKVAIGILT